MPPPAHGQVLPGYTFAASIIYWKSIAPGHESLSAAERCSRGFIGTRITNYGDDAVSLLGANALHRHLFQLTKLNLITKSMLCCGIIHQCEVLSRNYYCKRVNVVLLKFTSSEVRGKWMYSWDEKRSSIISVTSCDIFYNQHNILK